MVSSCNRERSSPEYIEQCVLEQTQNTVDLVLILSVQSSRRRGFIFEAQMTSTLDETTIWGDNFHTVRGTGLKKLIWTKERTLSEERAKIRQKRSEHTITRSVVGSLLPRRTGLPRGSLVIDLSFWRH